MCVPRNLEIASIQVIGLFTKFTGDV